MAVDRCRDLTVLFERHGVYAFVCADCFDETVLFERHGVYAFVCADCFDELVGIIDAEVPCGLDAVTAIDQCADWQRAGGGCQWCGTRYLTCAKEVHDAIC